MKFIKRWGLMHNNYPENIQEHSQRVAIIAHTLALIRNEKFGGTVNADRVAVMALYHDVSEVLTGDMPTPIKYFNEEIRSSYKSIEKNALEKLFQMIPDELKGNYQDLFFDNEEMDLEHRKIVSVADKLCAYIKCLEERRAGNKEFSSAEKALKKRISELGLPEAGYFMDIFIPSFRMTLDELNDDQ